MHRKNFWYPLGWSLHEYRAKAKQQVRNRVYSSPEPCFCGGSAADWRMGHDEPSRGMGTGIQSKGQGSWQGFKTQISRYVDDKLTVVVLTNLAEAKPKIFADHVAEMYLSGKIKAP
jgi:hypothetical protein